MRAQLTFFLALATALAACGDGPEQGATSSVDSSLIAVDTAKPAVEAHPTTKNDYQTKSGKHWVVEEEKMSASQSKLHITSQGFTAANDSMTIDGADPIEHALQADLNHDGFEELYLITRNTGSSNGATIYGFSSNRDKSFSSIHVQEVAEKDILKGGLFEGYMGHDSVYLQGKLLARQFPVYKAGDANATPTGGKRIVYYTLKPGEASWQLLINSTATAK